MKHNILFVYILSIIIFLSACISKDKKDAQRYTVSGHIYQNCNKQPVANRIFAFYQVGGGGGIIDSAKTDANGYFTLNYSPKNGSEVRVGIQLNVGMSEYGQFEPFKNYPMMALYQQPTCYLKVGMQVFNNSYTNKDTLYIGDARYNAPAPYLLKVPGPFTSKLLYEVPNYGILNYMFDSTYLPKVFRINNVEYNNGKVKLVACDTVNYIAEVR